MRRIGRKGEKVGYKKTLYLMRLLNDVLKKYSKDSGKSQSEIVEWCLGHSLDDFKERFCKEAKSEKEQQKNDDLIDAWKLSRKELVAYAQRTSERRFGQDILHGGHEFEIENFMRNMEPQSIWDRILGRKKGRGEAVATYEDGVWVDTGEQGSRSDYHMVYDDEHKWQKE